MASKRLAKRVGAAALGTVAAAIAGVALAVQPAAAATTSADQIFAFTPFGGPSEVSCTIHIQADFPFGSAHTGRAVTSVSGSDAACTSGVTTTTGAEYRDTNGDFLTVPYTYSFGPSHTQTYANVQRDFQTFHQVYFPACGCATNVYVLSTPNPK
jgi:hypothetical protein